MVGNGFGKETVLESVCPGFNAPVTAGRKQQVKQGDTRT